MCAFENALRNRKIKSNFYANLKHKYAQLFRNIFCEICKFSQWYWQKSTLIFSPGEVEKVAAIADDDGEVTREEFVNYAKHSEFFKGQMDKNSVDSVAAKQEAIAKAERAFKVFDKDNDGFITKEEFAKISKKLNKDQVDAVFNKFDKDGDGVLSFEEFKKMLNKDKK